jgi:hypothetical protein
MSAFQHLKAGPMVSWERKCKFVCSVVLVPFILFNAMKYLIAGLGNIGAEYDKTRHNIGFMLADALVAAGSGTYKPDRFAQVSRLKYKGRILVVIKPTTYMNLSGKAVKFWLTKKTFRWKTACTGDDLDLEPVCCACATKEVDGTITACLNSALLGPRICPATFRHRPDFLRDPG